MNRTIRKVAVLGSGIMGSRIACHFANIGLDVLLLDITPRELTDDEKKKGLTLDSPTVKNRIVQSSFDTAVKSNPAASRSVPLAGPFAATSCPLPTGVTVTPPVPGYGVTPA